MEHMRDIVVAELNDNVPAFKYLKFEQQEALVRLMLQKMSWAYTRGEEDTKDRQEGDRDN